MRSLQTITATKMRRINRSAILELIYQQGPVAPSVISKRLGVSLPTVARILDSLVTEGLVIQTGRKESRSNRQRSQVSFNGSDRLTIGIDLGGTKMFGAVADLDGMILHEETIAHHQTSGEDSYQRISSLIHNLLTYAKGTAKKIQGIGIGAPGITFFEEGIVQWAPSLGWRDFPLKDRLMADFNMPAVVENDVNLAALGETWFGAGRGTYLNQSGHTLVVIAIGTGIGSGIVIDGEIYRGSHQAAGEIGYLIPDRLSLDNNYEGFGAFEQLASGLGIAERASKLLEGKLRPSQRKKLTAQAVFKAARKQETWASQIVAETVDYLAQAIAAVSLCLDPDQIVLSGGVANSADLLIDPILDRLKGVIPILPSLIPSSLGYRAGVLGAVILLLHNTLDYYAVRKLS